MILQVSNLSKHFSGFVAVNEVSFDLVQGDLCAIIGPNGAGKSTLFNLLTGHVPATRGRVLFKGADITRLPAHRICRLGIGRSFQHANIFQRLSVFDNIQAAVLASRGKGLDCFSSLRGLFAEETDAILERIGLYAVRGEQSGSLSYGYQKQLELGIALACEPELILLDEPTAGMSAVETRQTIELIEKIINEQNLTLLFTEHDMSVVFSIARRIIVLHQGNLIASGAPAEVRANQHVQEVYFGKTA